MIFFQCMKLWGSLKKSLNFKSSYYISQKGFPFESCETNTQTIFIGQFYMINKNPGLCNDMNT